MGTGIGLRKHCNIVFDAETLSNIMGRFDDNGTGQVPQIPFAFSRSWILRADVLALTRRHPSPRHLSHGESHKSNVEPDFSAPPGPAQGLAVQLDQLDTCRGCRSTFASLRNW